MFIHSSANEFACLHVSASKLCISLQRGGRDTHRKKKRWKQSMLFCVFLNDCVLLFSSPAALGVMQWGCRREKATDRGDTGERKSTRSHTETINKISFQSISYGLVQVIALFQSLLCVAREQVQGDVIGKYEASTAVGLTLIVTSVIKRAEE